MFYIYDFSILLGGKKKITLSYSHVHTRIHTSIYIYQFTLYIASLSIPISCDMFHKILFKKKVFLKFSSIIMMNTVKNSSSSRNILYSSIIYVHHQVVYSIDYYYMCVPSNIVCCISLVGGYIVVICIVSSMNPSD